MKRLLLVFVLLLGTLALPARQAKRVYITLDVSGSMNGDKYSLANYTAQMLVTLCDPSDEVSLIVVGKEHNLTREADVLSQLQHPVSGHPYIPLLAARDDEINDIITFNRIYSPSSRLQDWLFVIGDGSWNDDSSYQRAINAFESIVKRGTLNVCYLQTGSSVNEVSDFLQSVTPLGVVDIQRTDTDPGTIREGCNHFAHKILGFSDVPLSLHKSGPQGLRIKAELPIRSFFVVYQEDVAPEELPQMTEATAAGAQLSHILKGTPTTIPTQDGAATVDLSGRVWHVTAQDALAAGEEIEVQFDKSISLSCIRVYPLVEDVDFSSVSLLSNGRSLKQLDSHSFSICRNESKAQVRVELDDASRSQLPEGLLKQTKVVVKANNRDYQARYKNGGFECEIDLLSDETPYYAEIDCPGYFKRVTPIVTIVKGECPSDTPPELPVREMPAADLGTISFEALKHETISFTLRDSLSNDILDPTLFDISFRVKNDFLYERPSMQVEDGNVIVLSLHPKGEWCECFFPESLEIEMVSTPKAEAFDEYGKNYRQTVFPFHLEVVKERTWLSRCWWVLMTLIGLLLLLWYLSALQRKRRFKKCAVVTPSYKDYRGRSVEQGGSYLRKDGFAAWLSRWFWPGDERITLSWNKPHVESLTFVAAESQENVLIPKEGIDPTTMKVTNYDPKKDPTPKEPVKFGNKGIIRVSTPLGKEEGSLVFTAGREKDGAGFRIFLTLLKIACILGIVFLLYMMVQSFI